MQGKEMEKNCEFPGEEKVADGIYITKCEKKATPVKPVIINEKAKEKEENKNPSSRYVYRSTAELIIILENEFEEIVMQIKMLYSANEEMLQFDPTDYDLIEARQENLEIINKKILRLKEIQSELNKFCPTNPLVLRDVFEYFLENQSFEEVKNLKNEAEITSNIGGMSNTNGENDSTTMNGNRDSELITEIEL
jgi:hypothetical protein